MRKTIDRELIVETANKMLANSKNEMTLAREGIKQLTTNLLIEANAYKGFRYLHAHDVEPGFTVGIIPDYETQKHVYPDETRIQFY